MNINKVGKTILLILCFFSLGANWLTMPSTYTHRNGERVTQFAPRDRVMLQLPSTFQSGYRHTESVIGRDRLHIIERWGNPRPYGEWQHPYRPYSVPYPYWGPQPAPHFFMR
jgi:hypothetical protein